MADETDTLIRLRDLILIFKKHAINQLKYSTTKPSLSINITHQIKLSYNFSKENIFVTRERFGKRYHTFNQLDICLLRYINNGLMNITDFERSLFEKTN